MLPLCSMAQEEFSVLRGNCMPDLEDASPAHRTARLPAINNRWDADRTYRQLVILVSFRDADFSCDNPMEYYDRLFNEPGFNEEKRNANGCIADYFRDQSGGLFNLKFDVYGPIKVDTLAQPYAKPTENTKNYGKDILRRATLQFLDSVAAGVYDNCGWDGDFAKYDWNNNGYTNQVIYVYAGVSGNINAEQCYGLIPVILHPFRLLMARRLRAIHAAASFGLLPVFPAADWEQLPMSSAIALACRTFIPPGMMTTTRYVTSGI